MLRSSRLAIGSVPKNCYTAGVTRVRNTLATQQPKLGFAVCFVCFLPKLELVVDDRFLQGEITCLRSVVGAVQPQNLPFLHSQNRT